MKTTFKKTLAALSAAAVVAASAAVFAVPTDAAGYGTITVDTVYITVDDAGSKVNVPVYISGNPGFNELGFGITYDENLTLSGAKESGILASLENGITKGIGNNAAMKLFWAGVSVNLDAFTASKVLKDQVNA